MALGDSFLWPVVAHPPPLVESQVHVWCAALEAPEELFKIFRQWLSSAEEERLNRYQFEADKRQFLIRRAFLRRLLGHYLKILPDEVRLIKSQAGKPSLHPSHSPRIHFNLTFSMEVCLLAFSLDRELGVDVELLRTDLDHTTISKRYFSKSEHLALQRLPAEKQPEAFFVCWTRKEAFVKAVGTGFSLPLEAFEVAFLPGEAPRMLTMRHKALQFGTPQDWVLYHLEPFPGYVGALAWRGGPLEPYCLSLQF